MNRLITISQSPHVSGDFTVKKIMYSVIIALLPALAVSIYYFGLDAVRVTLIAVASAVFFEYIIQKFLIKGKQTITDGSAIITGVLLAFNVPSNLPIWMIVIGALVAIGVGKMSFGGLGKNPFNPALVGRVFLLISFPVDMTIWPTNRFALLANPDAVTGATPLAILKEGVKNGEKVTDLLSQVPPYLDMFFGNTGGSLGEISAFALIIGLIYMLMKKVITWHIPVTMLGTIFIFSAILNFANPEKFADPVFHILTGGVMLGAIFMATDMVTSPMSKKGMIIFAAGIGIITIIIRNFGAYPEGVSFAILIMNAFVPLINKYFKPKLFGEKG